MTKIEYMIQRLQNRLGGAHATSRQLAALQRPPAITGSASRVQCSSVERSGRRCGNAFAIASQRLCFGLDRSACLASSARISVARSRSAATRSLKKSRCPLETSCAANRSICGRSRHCNWQIATTSSSSANYPPVGARRSTPSDAAVRRPALPSRWLHR